MKLSALCLLFLTILPLHGDEPPRTGPATEKRFPPLKLPSGFKATLFACDPFIEYPSVICNGPKTGSLFMGVDFMTGLGTDGVVKSEVRLLEDTDGDGYADKSTVYAKGFNSIQGIAYHNGTVWVMHAPYLTRLRDTKGTGVADERKDLLTGLGLKPEENPVRLHCANGVVVGHDGWLYLALGDHGCDVKRPEGDRLVLNGGGILRCRRDGSDLHIFATGTRNIYDISLDEDLNVFFRDNENDGGTYMIRVCHSFFGADHGYPYKYYERPDEALPPLADLGLGSSAGGVCYLETQFPKEYRGNLFNCEWGRSVVRSPLQRQGSGFAPVKEIEFAAGAENDPYGFKPTDLVVDRDGALFVSDWADGQRPKRGRGRVYRITFGEKNVPPKDKPDEHQLGSYVERVAMQERFEREFGKSRFQALDLVKHPIVDVRFGLHMVWVLAHVDGPKAIDDLFDLANRNLDVRLRVQAIRALTDLVDPVLVKHRLDAGPGDVKIAERLSKIAGEKVNESDPALLREITVALGRLRWPGSPAWLQTNLTEPDATLAHAAVMTLRKCGNWPEALKLIDLPRTEPIRPIALRALAEQYVPEVVDAFLIARLRSEKDPLRRREYADALTRVCKKPGPWVYWGYRPPPRPANTESWERTAAIETALDASLGDADKSVRLTVLRRMQREKVPVKPATLAKWLREETDAEPLGVLLDALSEQPASAVREQLEAVAADKAKPLTARQTALAKFAGGLDEASEARLSTLAKSLEDGAVLAEAIQLLSKRPKLQDAPFLLSKARSPAAAVRAAALDALADKKVADASKLALELLADPDVRVRRAAAAAVGRFELRPAADALLKLARDPNSGVRRASLESLRLFKEPRVVEAALPALADADTQLAALACIAELGGPEQAKALIDFAKQHPSADVLPLVLKALTKWGERPENWRVGLAISELHGVSGSLVCWNVAGPIVEDTRLIERFASESSPVGNLGFMGPTWSTTFGDGVESRVRIAARKGDGTMWLATTDLSVAEKMDVQFLAGSNSGLRIWLNGKLAHKRNEAQPYRPDFERFDAELKKGDNHLLIHFPAPKGDIDFHLRFRRKSSTAAHEKLTQAALTRGGNADRGKKLFLNAEKTQCLKCHRVGDQGEKIGPELTGLGNRFSRVYIVESILEPSRTIASELIPERGRHARQRPADYRRHGGRD